MEYLIFSLPSLIRKQSFGLTATLLKFSYIDDYTIELARSINRWTSSFLFGKQYQKCLFSSQGPHFSIMRRVIFTDYNVMTVQQHIHTRDQLPILYQVKKRKEHLAAVQNNDEDTQLCFRSPSVSFFETFFRES